MSKAQITKGKTNVLPQMDAQRQRRQTVGHTQPGIVKCPQNSILTRWVVFPLSESAHIQRNMSSTNSHMEDNFKLH
jgi:hypothetical protein